MHEIEINVALDHIDRALMRDAYVFHARGHNRISAGWSTKPPAATNLSVEKIHAMEFAEHVFGGQRVDAPLRGRCAAQGRKPSASIFSPGTYLLLDDLLDLLNASIGTCLEPPHTRPYPSGGALYCGQATIYARHVRGLKPGAYHYLPCARQLECLPARPAEEIDKYLFAAPADGLRDYAFFVLYSIMATFPLAKYGMRGYRLACIEIGSMYQSLICQSEKAGLRSRIWGGFADEALSVAMGIDPRVAWPVICHLAGKDTP